MDYSCALMDLTAFGRQEAWKDSPPGWPGVVTSSALAAARPTGPGPLRGRAAVLPLGGLGSRPDDQMSFGTTTDELIPKGESVELFGYGTSA